MWKEIDDKTFGKGFDCFSEHAICSLASCSLIRSESKLDRTDRAHLMADFRVICAIHVEEMDHRRFHDHVLALNFIVILP